MPALSRRSFVTLTALASSSILLSPRAFAGSGATSAAGKPQETFLDFNESPYGPSAKARAARLKRRLVMECSLNFRQAGDVAKIRLLFPM